MEQMRLTEAEAARDEAVARAAAHADARWKMDAREAVILAAVLHDEFTTDDVWAMLDSRPSTTHERRALGSIVKAVAKVGVIEPTGKYVKSCRPEAHCRPVMVWRYNGGRL